MCTVFDLLKQKQVMISLLTILLKYHTSMKKATEEYVLCLTALHSHDIEKTDIKQVSLN